MLILLHFCYLKYKVIKKQSVGLNQIHEVKKERFGSEKQYNMFCRRLNVLNQNLI